ncbi:hypothetical protein YC2023_067169 [Brassica napus]
MEMDDWILSTKISKPTDEPRKDTWNVKGWTSANSEKMTKAGHVEFNKHMST